MAIFKKRAAVGRNIMVDLETMSSDSYASIVAIGAVQFSEIELLEEFYVTVDLESCIEHGLDVSASTIMWWLRQSQDAQEMFQKNATHSLTEALDAFSQWLKVIDVVDPLIWGNGANFDNVILANAYGKAGKELPWGMWNNRCYRTFKSLYPKIRMKRSGVHHHALDDAKSQALHMIEIYQNRTL